MEKIIEKMKERGYSFAFEIRDGNNNTLSVVFSYLNDNNSKERFPIPTYNVTVYPRSEEFEMSYHSDNSLNILCTPKCGSFFNDEHFDRIAIKFEHDAAILNKYK